MPCVMQNLKKKTGLTKTWDNSHYQFFCYLKALTALEIHWTDALGSWNYQKRLNCSVVAKSWNFKVRVCDSTLGFTHTGLLEQNPGIRDFLATSDALFNWMSSGLQLAMMGVSHLNNEGTVWHHSCSNLMVKWHKHKGTWSFLFHTKHNMAKDIETMTVIQCSCNKSPCWNIVHCAARENPIKVLCLNLSGSFLVVSLQFLFANTQKACNF